MSKQRTSNTAVAQGTKQQVSKILMGQMLTWAKRYINLSYMPYSYKASQVESSVITKIMRSGYGRDGAITSWTSDDFDFRFEYGRRGGVRVSYMNNQGLQSAIFQKDEWICMMNYIGRKIQRLLNAEKAKEEEEKRKAEEEEFWRHVISVILDDVSIGDTSKIRNLLEVEQAIHGNLSDNHCKCSCTHGKVAGEVGKDIDKAPSYTMDELEGKSDGDDFVEV